jgi:cobalt-zinc-cadmium resistance protein CzcA
MTYNGEVDAVGGVVMMLKGENSNEVVKRIKEKLPTIQKSLPDDIVIEPYLDRTDLVKQSNEYRRKKFNRRCFNCHFCIGFVS